jgi:phosphoglycolate phosphatase
MIKMVAFDFDGTIGDTMEMCISVFKQILTPYLDHTATYEEIAGTFGLNEKGMLKLLVGDNWQKAYDELVVLYKQNLQYCRNPFPGIPELIEELKSKNILTALITGKGKETCDMTLAEYGMTRSFCAVETGRDDRTDKDSAMKRLIETYHLLPGEFMYIGDTVYDAEAAHKAGVVCLSAAYGGVVDTAALEKVNPGKVFTTVDAMKNYFETKIFQSFLFICRGNAARSQFAEALMRSHGYTNIYSAGMHVSGKHQNVCLRDDGEKALRAVTSFKLMTGIDISDNRRKLLCEEDAVKADTIISFLSQPDLPSFMEKYADKLTIWDVPDPKEMDEAGYTAVINEIKDRVTKVNQKYDINYTIEKPSPEDAEQILEYLKQVGSESDNLSFGSEGLPFSAAEERDFIKSSQNSKTQIWFVAKDNGKIIGDCNIDALPRRFSHRGELGIAVIHDYCNRGVGSALIKKALDAAKNILHLEIITLEVKSDNYAAIHVYEKFGFEKFGTYKKFFKKGNDYFDADYMNLYFS